MSKHQFALYYEPVAALQDKAALTDTPLLHRIEHVLRLHPGDTIILFNQKQQCRFTLQTISKKTITGSCTPLVNNPQLSPHITLLLPLLKRESCEQAVYHAVESGASCIQLLHTQKVKRKWQGKKELERLQRIVIAAAEQAKHFSFPTLLPPISLEEALQNTKHPLYFADPEGVAFSSLTPPEKLTLCVGPEGDLTDEEKGLLRKYNATFVKLTPTILRSQQAAILFVGIFMLQE